MGKVYTTQDNLTLYVETGADLTDAANTVIEGTDPDGTAITPLGATIESASDGLITYNITSTDFITAGTYILWVKINYVGGSTSWGEPFHFNVYETGD